MGKQTIGWAQAHTHFADSFHEIQTLNVADGSTNLNNVDVKPPTALGNFLLDVIGNVRDDLNGLA